MSTFVIAGLSNDPELAKAEMLGHHLQKNLPDFHISIQMKAKEEWNDYKHQLFHQKRWSERMSFDRTFKTADQLPQLIFRPSGELIGDTNDFIHFVKHAYAVEMSFDDALLTDIAIENSTIKK
jgi:hypothetical protein